MQQDRLCEMQDVLRHLTDRKNLWAIGDGKNGFSSVPNGFFCYCYTVKIKLNILTLNIQSKYATMQLLQKSIRFLLWFFIVKLDCQNCWQQIFLSQTGNSLEYFKYTKFRDGRCNGYDDHRNERTKRLYTGRNRRLEFMMGSVR